MLMQLISGYAKSKRSYEFYFYKNICQNLVTKLGLGVCLSCIKSRIGKKNIRDKTKIKINNITLITEL